jgi:hypothetical protein
MKTSQHTSKGISQIRQLEIAKNMNQSFINDNDKFKAFDPELNLNYAAIVQTQIEAVEAISPDYVLRAQQMRETQNVIKVSNAAISNIRNIKYFVERAFPDDPLHLYEFGFPELRKVVNTQSKLVEFLKNFAISVNKYKAELTAKGLPQAAIDQCNQIAIDLERANIQQIRAKKARYIATGHRVKAYNQLWQLIGNVAKAGKLIFENQADYQRNYILDDAPRKKTIKQGDTETVTTTLQGCITDAQTNQAIEDAIVEIQGTPHSTTTDQNGEFYIDEIPSGTYTLAISAVGYTQLQACNIRLVLDNEEQEFNFALQTINVDAM